MARHHVAELRRHRAAGEHADHRERAAGPDAAQRLRQGFLAAQLDNMVVAAAAGDFARGLGPLRRFQVIDRSIGAERPGAGDLVVARGNDGDVRAEEFRDPDREQRHSARALHQHFRARAERFVRDESAPRRERRARQRRRLEIRKVRRRLDQSLLMNAHQLRHGAVHGPAQCAGEALQARRTGDPSLLEARKHPVSDLHPGHAGSDLDDFPDSVGKRNQRQLAGVRAIPAARHQQIPVVDGGRFDA